MTSEQTPGQGQEQESYQDYSDDGLTEDAESLDSTQLQNARREFGRTSNSDNNTENDVSSSEDIFAASSSESESEKTRCQQHVPQSTAEEDELDVADDELSASSTTSEGSHVSSLLQKRDARRDDDKSPPH